MLDAFLHRRLVIRAAAVGAALGVPALAWTAGTGGGRDGGGHQLALMASA